MHWHHHEKPKLTLYVERRGGLNGTAAVILANLFDLLPANAKGHRAAVAKLQLQGGDQRRRQGR
jgi:hypothetical protein